MGAAAACAAYDIVKNHAHILCLLNGLPCGVHIAKGTSGHGAAHGHKARLMTLCAEIIAYAFHLPINFVKIVGINNANVHAQQAVDYLIAQLLPHATLLQHQYAAKAQPAAAGCGQHSVVALGAAGGKHIVAALLHCVRNEELQLADLVAAKGNACHVVALYVNIFAQHPADIWQPVHGGGQQPKGYTGKIRKLLHGCVLLISFARSAI